MPASGDGEIYTFASIPLEMNASQAVNPLGVDSVQGCVPMKHDLMSLVNLWIPKTQMMQVPQGFKWCKVCGEARPHAYFDVVEWDERGKAVKWNDKGQPMAWDGIRFPVKWHDTCRQCVNAHDPKLAKEKYCSACKVMHPRADFADDTARADGKYPMCVNGKKRYDAARYAEKRWTEEGRLPGQWGGHREKVFA